MSIDPEAKKRVYTQGEHDILVAVALMKKDLERGNTRFGDHETRLRSLERRFWMTLGGGLSLLIALEALALAGVTR